MASTRTITMLATAVATLAAAGPASAAERWADDAANPASTDCSLAVPCTLETAINDALASDDVIVMPGTYELTAPLSIADGIRVRGEDGEDRPVLRGGSELTETLVNVSDAATLSHAEIEARGAGQHALKLKKAARGDRLILRSDNGDGGKITADPGGTMLTNSLVTTDQDDEDALTLDGNAPGATAVLRNVTVYARQSTAIGINCATKAPATATIVNSIIRGGWGDVISKTGACTVDHSNIRSALSQNVSPTNNTTAEPILDILYRPLGGSNSLDAGIDDAANGPSDLAGAARTQGALTDIGAYEYGLADPTPALGLLPPVEPRYPPDSPGSDSGSDATTPVAAPAPSDVAPAFTGFPGSGLPPAAPPQLGRSILLDTGNGTVKVKVPGTKGFVALTDASSLPVGTVIDTRKGSVTLASALPGGKRQSGTFSAGMFTVRQDPKAGGMVDIKLAGGSFSSCPKAASRKARGAVAHAAGARKPVRRLWSKDKGGRFRTHGRESVATVRGTRWLTEDRCDGTYTKVVEGAVDVRAKGGKKVTRVRAGRSILVR